MKASIVIPCYNKKNTIKKIVEAVRNAPVNNKEIIEPGRCNRGLAHVFRREISGAIGLRCTD